MKKLILGGLLAAFVSVSLAVGAHAAPPQTDVTGVVTENQMPVAGATVTVQCGTSTEVDTATDAQGSYLVTFPSADCPFGSTVKVTAKKGGKSGVSSGTVHGITTKLNLAIVNVAIPEYGALGLLAAGGVGLGLMAYMRRRQQEQML
ncbi:MAG TPA: hypothetical protein VFO38_01860 [Candidatus Saccharimonadales bacterium]|nr:hypothetical protein [Candidatus Saccharimonadales bacterium]